jgi:nucleotide-binding universal stress UspA family protein
MYKRILVATDGTERAAGPIHAALDQAQAGGGMIVAVHVLLESPFVETGGAGLPVYDAFRLQAEQQGQDALAYVARCADTAGVRCETILVPAGPAWEGIIATARAQACDLIVMGSTRRHGMAARLLGSETQRVLTHCNLPVLVVH